MPLNLREILNHRWVHSHEEDSATGMVFRLAEYSFPPSRGRMSFTLREDHMVDREGPGAGDSPEKRRAKWRLDKSGNLAIEYEKPQLDRRVKFLTVDRDRLVLEKPGL